MATIIARETLEGIFQRPVAQRTPDHHEYLYRNVLVLEGRAAQNAEMVHILLLRARVIADMEPDIFSLVTIGQREKRWSGHDALKAAFEVAGQALALADALQDQASQGRAHLLRGKLFRRLGDFRASADAYHASANLLERVAERSSAIEPSLVRDLLEATIKRATMEHALGEIEAAQRSLDKQVQIAHQMSARGAKVPFDTETVEWMQALLARARGEPVKAFISATSAADAYLRKEPCISLVRVLWLATEVALDLVEDAANAGESIRKPFADAAQRYLRLTTEYADRVKDPAGVEMATLSEARVMQLDRPSSKVPTNRVRAMLDRIEKSRDWDWPLKVDAYTTLGRLLTIRELATEAREALDQAARIADEHHSPGMAWFARAALDDSHRPRPAVVVGGDHVVHAMPLEAAVHAVPCVR